MLNIGPPSDEIQRLLPVALLKEAEDNTIQGITRFQKLVFILQKGDLIDKSSLDENQEYEYEPHNYGPYSKELHDWLDRLSRKGIINKDSTSTSAGNQKEIFKLNEAKIDQEFDLSGLDDDFEDRVTATVDEFNHMSILELLDIVYDEYPEYAVNSNL